MNEIIKLILSGHFSIKRLGDNTFDVTCNKGEVLRSPVSGLIRAIGSHNIDGKYIHINLRNGGHIRLLHLGDVLIKSGVRVNMGDPIAICGRSGMLKHDGFRVQILDRDSNILSESMSLIALGLRSSKPQIMINTDIKRVINTSLDRNIMTTVDELLSNNPTGVTNYGRLVVYYLLKSGLPKRSIAYIYGVAAGESNLQNVSEKAWSIDQIIRYKRRDFRSDGERNIAMQRKTMLRNFDSVSEDFIRSIKGNDREIFALMYDGNKMLGHGDFPYPSYVGYKYRGRGAIGFTGLSLYKAAAKYFNDSRILNEPDVILRDDDLSARMVVWFFKVYKRNTAYGKKILEGTATFDEILASVAGTKNVESVKYRLASANSLLENINILV